MSQAFLQALETLRSQAAQLTDSTLISTSYEHSASTETFKVDLQFVLISGDDWTAAWTGTIQSLSSRTRVCHVKHGKTPLAALDAVLHSLGWYPARTQNAL